MAGGMTPGRGETLAERIATTKAREAERTAQARGHGTAGFHGKRPAPWSDVLRDRPAAPAAVAPVTPHCWYDGPHGPQPALLLEWSNGVDGYRRARIAVAAPHHEEGWAITEMWVEQDVIRPA